jgi:hypothetical protein
MLQHHHYLRLVASSTTEGDEGHLHARAASCWEKRPWSIVPLHEALLVIVIVQKKKVRLKHMHGQ